MRSSLRAARRRRYRDARHRNAGDARTLHQRRQQQLEADELDWFASEQMADATTIAAASRLVRATCWQHGHLLGREPVELVGFELLLADAGATCARRRRFGALASRYLRRRAARKLDLIPAQALYSPRTTVVHSLSSWASRSMRLDCARPRALNGAVGNSPAADRLLPEPLRRRSRSRPTWPSCLDWSGGATVPVLHPCETFELVWSAYHRFLGGAPSSSLLSRRQRAQLHAMLAKWRRQAYRQPFRFLMPTTPPSRCCCCTTGDTVDPHVLRSFEANGRLVS